MRSERAISKRGAAFLAAVTLAGPAALVAASHAEPPQGVSATVLSRAKLQEFKLRSAADAPFDFLDRDVADAAGGPHVHEPLVQLP